MKDYSEIIKTHFSLISLVLLVSGLGLYLTSLYSYLLFHTLAEFFCVIIASAVFIFAWNTRHIQNNHYVLFLGIAYLFVGSIDLVHTLAYKGMNIFEGITVNPSIQLWITARYLESISLLLAFFFLRKKINEYLVTTVYLTATILLFLVVFVQSIFPDCYIEGVGLTAFKKNSEYLICLLLLCSLFLLRKNRFCFDNTVLHFMQAAVILTIMSELAFTCYIDLYGSFNMLGHFLKIFSFYSIYRAIIETSLNKPNNILFRELNTHGTELENKVRERTAALQQSTEYLEKEITERIKAEKDLRWELSVNRELARVSDTLISQYYSIRETAEVVLVAAKKLTDSAQGMVTSIDALSGAVTGYTLPDSAAIDLTEGPGQQQSINEHHPVTLSVGDDGEYPGLWGRALNSRQGFYIDFVPAGDPSTGIPAGCEPHKNYLNVPVIIDKRPVGQIALADKQGSFTRHDLLAIERLAALFALFIQRKHMEDALSRTELKYRSLFNDALDMIHIVDENKKIINVNPVELRTMGYSKEKFIGKSLLDTIHPDFQERTADALKRIFSTGRCVKNYETALISKNGERVDVEVSAVPQLDKGKVVSVRAIMRNITDRKKEEQEKKNLETQLRQSHKMEAVGTLAGGIAHDFNNILGPILGYTELALDVLPADHQTTPWLREVLHAGHRARELVRQILTISRKTDQDVQPIMIQLLIKETLKLLRSSIPSSIEIRQNLAPDCEAVSADPTRIHQVIMNLCTNAYYAMRKDGGVLEISLKPVELTSEDLRNKMRLRAGSYLKLSVGDTGCGIPENLLEKIFEPYFTTKAQGEGTGLGLALVQSIILDFGGDIMVYSEPDQGTLFHIYLPTIATTGDSAQAEDTAPLPQGNERIMVVDDDRELVQMSRRLLESLGYQVTVKTDSLDAFTAFQRRPDAFDLVLTDMTMPQMTGDELSKKILAVRPDIPVIICTGFSELIDEKKAKEIGVRALVMKPFTKKELAQSVREVLDDEIKVR